MSTEPRVPNAPPTALRSVTIPLQTVDEQDEIVRQVRAVLAKAEQAGSAIDAARDRAARFHEALVAKAFRGELAALEL